MTPIENIMDEALSRYVFAHELDGLGLKRQERVGDYRVDFLITGLLMPVVVECDGHDYHEKTKEQARRDRQMDRRLQILGCAVLRFTGSEIWNDVESCLKEVNQLAFRLWRTACYGKPPRPFLLNRMEYKVG